MFYMVDQKLIMFFHNLGIKAIITEPIEGGEVQVVLPLSNKLAGFDVEEGALLTYDDGKMDERLELMGYSIIGFHFILGGNFRFDLFPENGQEKRMKMVLKS